MKEAPAFPTTVRGKQEGRNMKPLQRLEGMTLRDYFAAKALAALIMNVSKMTKQQIEEYTPQEACALVAYLYADAMMEARNGKR